MAKTEENINKTTEDMINHSNNRMDQNNAGFNDFDGNIDNFNVNSFASTSSHNLDIDNLDNINNVSLDSRSSFAQDSEKQETITQQVNRLFKVVATKIKTMNDAAYFKQEAEILLDELYYLIDIQKELHKQNMNALAFEEKNKGELNFFARLFKTESEKKILATLKKITQTVEHYKHLIKRLKTQISVYPSNEDEKRAIIKKLTLHIKELQLGQKELLVNNKVANATVQNIKANTASSSAKKKKGVGNNSDLFDIDGLGDSVDDLVNNFFSFGGEMSEGKATEKTRIHTDKIVKNEQQVAEIEQKIIALERKIISWERFE